MTGQVMLHLRSGDLWAGICVAGLGAVGLVAALDIFVPTGLNDFLGPRVFPITISLMLIVLGAALAIRSAARRQSEEADFGRRGTLLLLVVAVTVYVLLFGALGFLLATALFLAALFVYLGERKIWVAVVVAAVIATAVTVGFASGLNVALPRGPFGF